jgi:hypothetical protein
VELFPKQTRREGDGELHHLLKERATASSAIPRAKLCYESANSRAMTDWSFQRMLPSKDNHNVHGKQNFFPGLGTTKLRKLILASIDSCFELMQANPRDHPAIRPLGSW